ncbi:MAG: hypothetical protein Q9O74_07225 [Planctomycetota bacterium]|nr:hypothetical protein [Planctomycetota bacterium]
MVTLSVNPNGGEGSWKLVVGDKSVRCDIHGSDSGTYPYSRGEVYEIRLYYRKTDDHYYQETCLHDFDYAASVSVDPDFEGFWKLVDPDGLIGTHDAPNCYDSHDCNSAAKKVAYLVIDPVDLDIDSDNDDGFTVPIENQDPTEDEGHGKLIGCSTYDTDGDGVPDYADGIGYTGQNGTWGIGTASAGVGNNEEHDSIRFVPIKLTLIEDLDNPATTLTFTYPANDPNTLQPPQLQNGNLPPEAQYYTFPTPDGYLRIWTKDGEEERNPADLNNGGDWIAPGVAYPRSYFDMDSLQRITLYVEAVAPWSRDSEAATISVAAVAPPGSDLEGEDLTDSVRALPVELQVFDMRHWDPSAQNGDTVSFANGAYDAYMPNARVQGAITDGTSLCLVRLEPPVDDIDIEIRRWKKGESALWSRPTNIRVFGGLVPTSNGAEPPPLPLPRPGTIPHTLADGATTSSSMAFYVPPDDYLIPGDYGPEFYLSDSTAMDSGEETAITFAIYAKGQAWLATRSAFQLRRPPIILVHGLYGAAQNYWGAVYDESLDLPLPTRLYFADYAVTHVRGYDINYRHVPLTIQGALNEYRNAIDLFGNSFGEHATTRGFHGLRYAATRADVVGHSLGGVITRFYISGISAAGPRMRPFGQDAWVPTGWDDYNSVRDNSNADGQWFYLRNANFWAGDIRRFISIGSPFRGSAISTAGEQAFEPEGGHMRQSLKDYVDWNTNDAYSLTTGALIAPKLMSNYPNGFDEHPTALFDLAEGTVLQRLMEGVATDSVGATGSGAQYPEGHRSVAWWPLAGRADTFIVLEGIIADLLDFLYEADPEDERLQSLTGDNSDGVVTIESQKNWNGDPDHVNAGIGDVFSYTRHSGDITDSNAEPSSASIMQKIQEILGFPAEAWHLEGLDK